MEDDERKNVVASGIGTLLTMGGGNISIDMAMPGCKISEKKKYKTHTTDTLLLLSP